MFEVRAMLPADLAGLERQPSQADWFGLSAEGQEAEAAELITRGEAWAIISQGRVVACMGIGETFPGTQGVCWALLGIGIGTAHIGMTRFACGRVQNSPLQRIEAVCRANDAEAILADFPGLDAQQLLEAVMVRPTPECAWARLCGLKPAHVLRRFGASAQTHVLFERIAP